jgi:peroxiredoxin
MRLQQKLDALKRQFESGAPPEALTIMHRAKDDLLHSGIMEGVLKAGERAPEFPLPDEHGSTVRSSELLDKGPLIVSFYRGVWWPFCNLELEALQGVAADVEALGASIIAISPQLEKYSKQVAKKHNLTFRVLGDQGNKVASKFGLVFRLPEDLRKLYSDFGIDLERFNGDDAWALPMPGRFILDRQGTILSAEVNPDYTRRPEPDEIVRILKSLGRGKGAGSEPAAA